MAPSWPADKLASEHKSGLLLRRASTQEDPRGRFWRQFLSAPGQPAAPSVGGAGAAPGLPGHQVCLLRASEDGAFAPKGVEAAEGRRLPEPMWRLRRSLRFGAPAPSTGGRALFCCSFFTAVAADLSVASWVARVTGDGNGREITPGQHEPMRLHVKLLPSPSLSLSKE